MSSKSIIRALKQDAVLSWKAGTSIPVKPEVVSEELKKIHARTNGIEAAAIVDQAAPDGAPLHPAFEWDDSTAAHAYRLDQAGHLIRAVVVSVRREDGTMTNPVRAFVSVTKASLDGDDDDEDRNPLFAPRVYVPIANIVGEEDARRRYMMRAYQELQVWRKRYKDIVAFAHIFEEIDRLAETVAS